MKRVFYIVAVLMLSVFIFFGYNYAAGSIKTHLASFLEKGFKVTVSIESVGVCFPFCLELKGVEIGDVVSVGSVRIYPRLSPFFLKNNFLISKVKIINPVIRLKKAETGQPIFQDFLNNSGNLSNVPLPKLYFSNVHIHNGALMYDNGSGSTLEFTGIKGDIQDPSAYFLKGDPLRFAATGFLKNKDSDFLSPLIIDSVIKLEGDIKARLQLRDVKIDTLGFFYVKYLSNFIKEGRVDLKSDIKISKKYLTAKCFVEGEDIVKKKSDKKIDTPLAASFILFVNFRNNLVKIKNLRGNFLKTVLDR